jgi:hypothetical protein
MSGTGNLTFAPKLREVFGSHVRYGHRSCAELIRPISRNQPGAEETHRISFFYVLRVGFLRDLFLDL